MNSWLILTVVGLAASTLLSMAGPPLTKGAPHRVVFEFVSEETKQQEALLNNIENVLKALGAGTQVLVVAHGPGLNLLHRPEKAIAERITGLAGQKVTFAACQNTMKRKNVSREDLLPAASTVDSGVAEVVRKQEDGWSYIKSGH
jgi:uncharacterized protein